MERQAEQPLFVLLVGVAHPVANVEEDVRLRRRVIVREDVDHPLLDQHEHAVRSVAGVGQERRPERRDLPVLAFVAPAGPLQVWETPPRRRSRSGESSTSQPAIVVGSAVSVPAFMSGTSRKRPVASRQLSAA